MADIRERYVMEDEMCITIMQISRLIGIAPIRLQKTNTHTIIYISRILLIYGILCSTIFHVAYMYSVINQLHSIITSDVGSKKNTTFILLVAHIVSMMVLNNYGVFYGVSRIRNFMYCINEIEKIKKRTGTTYDCKFSKLKFYGVLSMTTLTMWILGILDVLSFNQWNKPRNYFLYAALTVQCLMELQFIVIATFIKSAYKVINKSLQELLTKIHFESEIRHSRSENLLKTSDLKIPIQSIGAAIDLIGMKKQNIYPDFKIMQRTIYAQKIRQITHCFVSTSEVLRKVNRSEGFVLVVQLTILSVDIVLTVHNALHAINDDESFSKDNLLKILQTVWFIYHITKTILFVEPCYRTEKEVSNTRFLVGRIMCYVTSEVDPVRDEIDDFFKQLLLNDISYSAMGICNIGRPLMSTIIGSVTTIIIFLYQF